MRRALRVAAVLTVAAVVAGGVAVTVGVGTPLRSALSYAVGLAGALVVVAVSTSLVALAAARSPVLSLAVAIGCYAATVLGFAVVLAATDPTVVETRALAAGLGSAVLVATVAALLRATRPPQDDAGASSSGEPVGDELGRD